MKGAGGLAVATVDGQVAQPAGTGGVALAERKPGGIAVELVVQEEQVVRVVLDGLVGPVTPAKTRSWLRESNSLSNRATGPLLGVAVLTGLVTQASKSHASPGVKTFTPRSCGECWPVEGGDQPLIAVQQLLPPHAHVPRAFVPLHELSVEEEVLQVPAVLVDPRDGEFVLEDRRVDHLDVRPELRREAVIDVVAPAPQVVVGMAGAAGTETVALVHVAVAQFAPNESLLSHIQSQQV